MADNNSLQVTAPALVLNGQTINSGINFDMDLPNMADLISSAMSFTNSSNAGNQAFLGGVITQAGSNVGGYMAQAAPLYGQIAAAAASNAQAAIAAENAAASKPSGPFGCFVTTAVCEYEGLADDCDLLKTLRHFRDSYMQRTEERRYMCAVYYVVAPLIVHRLNSLPRHERDNAYGEIRKFIHYASDAIKRGDYQTGYVAYMLMLEFAAKVTRCTA